MKPEGFFCQNRQGNFGAQQTNQSCDQKKDFCCPAVSWIYQIFHHALLFDDRFP